MKNLIRMMIVLFIMLLCGCERVKASEQTATAFAGVYSLMAETYAADSVQRYPTMTPVPIPTETPTPTATQEVIIYYPVFETETEEPIEATPTLACYDAAYISDLSIPDGSVLYPGSAFVKTWKIKNTGSCEWTPLFALDYGSGDIMSGTAVPINQTIKPGEILTISVPLVAPSEEGVFSANWIMRNETWDHFGQVVFVTIHTKLDQYTATPSQ